MNRKRYDILLLLSFMILLISCGGTPQQRNMLSRAERLMNNHPDSVLKILDSARNEAPNYPRSLRMKYELLHAAAQNKAYISFTSDSVMKEVVDYYDSHGTANEQLQAHYVLGCVYRDLNDAPKALQCYYDAVDKADTTSSDCDYYTLCCVHSQMYILFGKQGYDEQALSEINKMYKCALLGKDTVGAINAYEYKSNLYYVNGNLDSAYNISLNASRQYSKYGYIKESARALNNVINVAVTSGDYSHAKKYIDIYESQSGIFDSCHHIISGFESHYSIKGLYYYGINKLDSAEYYFRKEMREGKDIKNQKYSSHGLFLVYSRRKDADSIVKYSQMCYDATDSFQLSVSADNLRQIGSLYDYGRYQRMANLEAQEASVFRLWLVTSSAVFIILILLSIIMYRRNKERMAQINHENEMNMERLENKEADLEKLKKSNHESNESMTRLKSEIINLQTAISESNMQNKNILSLLTYKESELTSMQEKIECNNALIDSKRTEISELQQKLSVLQEDHLRPDEWDLESDLFHSPILATLHECAAKGKKASDPMLNELIELMEIKAKEFVNTLGINENKLSYHDVLICILVKLRFLSSEICILTGVSSQNLTNVRARLLNKIFHAKKGGAKDFDRRIRQMK